MSLGVGQHMKRRAVHESVCDYVCVRCLPEVENEIATNAINYSTFNRFRFIKIKAGRAFSINFESFKFSMRQFPKTLVENVLRSEKKFGNVVMPGRVSRTTWSFYENETFFSLFQCWFEDFNVPLYLLILRSCPSRNFWEGWRHVELISWSIHFLVSFLSENGEIIRKFEFNQFNLNLENSGNSRVIDCRRFYNYKKIHFKISSYSLEELNSRAFAFSCFEFILSNKFIIPQSSIDSSLI